MKAKPIGERIIVSPAEASERKLASGLIIESKSDTFPSGVVVSVPDGCESVAPGQTVVYASGTEVKVGGESFTVVEMSAVIAALG
jgi:co-chaperonin GroES (HSP10)